MQRNLEFSSPISYYISTGDSYGIESYIIWTGSIKVSGFQGEILVAVGARDGLALDNTEPTPVMFFGLVNSELVDLSKRLNPDSVSTVITRDIVFTDFNNDGLIDIFLGNTGTEKSIPFPGEQNNLLIQTSGGSFKDASGTLPKLTDFTHGSDTGDLNGDGLADIYVNNLGEDDGNPSYILFNDGNGGFTYASDTRDLQNGIFDKSVQKFISPPQSLIIDVDLDGDNDIFYGVFSTWNSEKFSTDDHGFGYLENNNGVFNPVFDDNLFWPKESSSIFKLDKVDFNLDGYNDIVGVGSMPDGEFIVQLYYSGPGGLRNVSSTVLNLDALEGAVINGGISLQVIDINGDGALDFEARGWGDNFSSEVRYTFINDRRGNFDSPIKDVGGLAESRGGYADLNGDGPADFVYEGINGLTVMYGIVSSSLTKIIVGGNDSDTLIADDNSNELKGNSGNDFLYGAAGNDLLMGDYGSDYLEAGPGYDTIYGSLGADTLLGGLGADVLFGGQGYDQLLGGRGYDDLQGGLGNDTLRGALGQDTLIGGDGQDAFVFETSLDGLFNIDTVTDFVSGVDRIELSSAIFSAFNGQSGQSVGLSDYLIYDQASGRLSYDADGAGAGASIVFAVIGSSYHPAIGNDFWII